MSSLSHLQRLGFRRTAQRARILEVLEATAEHLTATEIADAALQATPPVNRSTVYRTLETLVEAGVVRTSRLGRSLRYELARGEGEHHHMVCSKCRATVHLDGPEVAAMLAREAAAAGFTVDEVHLLVGGTCADCARGGARPHAR